MSSARPAGSRLCCARSTRCTRGWERRRRPALRCGGTRVPQRGEGGVAFPAEPRSLVPGRPGCTPLLPSVGVPPTFSAGNGGNESAACVASAWLYRHSCHGRAVARRALRGGGARPGWAGRRRSRVRRRRGPALLRSPSALPPSLAPARRRLGRVGRPGPRAREPAERGHHVFPRASRRPAQRLSVSRPRCCGAARGSTPRCYPLSPRRILLHERLGGGPRQPDAQRAPGAGGGGRRAAREAPLRPRCGPGARAGQPHRQGARRPRALRRPATAAAALGGRSRGGECGRPGGPAARGAQAAAHGHPAVTGQLPAAPR